MSLTGFHPLWDKIISQNPQAVADQGCHLQGSSPSKGTAYRGLLYMHIPTTAILAADWVFGVPAEKAAGGPEPPSNPEPFTLEELPLEDQKLTGWRMVKRIHQAAVADERDTYVDPASTYTVFTSRCPISPSCHPPPPPPA
jgi:hypothetical protein